MDPIPPNLSFLFHQIYKSAESDNCEHEVLAEDMKRKPNILLRLTYNNKIFHTIILSIFRKIYRLNLRATRSQDILKNGSTIWLLEYSRGKSYLKFVFLEEK